MSLGKAKTAAGCEINIGAHMGDACPACGATNFGGEEFCRSERERLERLQRPQTKEG